MNNGKALATIWNEAMDDDLWFDDLREHDQDDLVLKFGITEHDANILWKGIQAECDVKRSVGHLTAQPFFEAVQVAVHDGFHGFDEEDQVVIRAFLSDITDAAHRL